MADSPRNSVLSAEERERLGQINRFLVNVTVPDHGLRASRAGYRSKDHTEGLELYRKAAGQDRPFEHALATADRQIIEHSGESTLSRYQWLDDFENKWFEQIDPLIDRFVPKPKRERLKKAFFKDLSQQPLGPGVVDSVSVYLDRLADLQEQEVEGVADIFEALVARGLTQALRDDARAEITRLRTLTVDAPPPVVSDDVIVAADAAQREAFEQLNEWYVDVATNLRPKLGYHLRVTLGLSERKGGRRVGEGTSEETEEPEEETPATAAAPAR